jgi:hypothetical protein
MIKRSPYDHSSPSPSEELMGLCHGISSENIDQKTAISALKSWMIDHISEKELSKMESRDPLWNFFNESNNEGVQFHLEWGKRIKDGEFLSPLPDMKYKPRIKLVR